MCCLTLRGGEKSLEVATVTSAKERKHSVSRIRPEKEGQPKKERPVISQEVKVILIIDNKPIRKEEKSASVILTS